MRLMTGVAGDPSGVIRRDNLREVLRLGSVCLVTAGAYDGCIQLLGLHRTRIIRMLSLGPVASLASDHYMPAKFFLIDDVGVAAFAGLVSGKRNRSRRDLSRSPLLGSGHTARKVRGTTMARRTTNAIQPIAMTTASLTRCSISLNKTLRSHLPGPRDLRPNCAMFFDTRDSSRKR